MLKGICVWVKLRPPLGLSGTLLGEKETEGGCADEMDSSPEPRAHTGD